jgi:hypothetical protein
MLTNEATGLILDIASGIYKLTKRIDLLWAEKEALQRPLALPLPKVALPPTQPQMVSLLDALLVQTKDESPDPLGKDRADIESLLNANSSSAELFDYVQEYLPERALGEVLDLDGTFISEIKKVRPDLAADREILAAAFYIGAGKDERNKSYTWRLALTVVDTFAEFGAENTALFTRDEGIQSVVGSVLKRFGAADVQTLDSNSAVLQVVLQSTLNGVLENRSSIEVENEWLNALLDALIAARDSLPVEEQDNFIAGLVKGKGYPLLVGSLLEQGAGVLAKDGEHRFADVASTFLTEVSDIVKQKQSFEGFFQDHWGDLLRAGFTSLEEHGPALLDDSNPLLREVLVAVAGNLARSPSNKFLTSDMLVGIVETAIATVAANPDKVNDLVKQEWLGALVSSISTTVAIEGFRNSFTKRGLEALVKDTLGTFAEHPELIASSPGLPRDLLRGLLETLSNTDSLSAEALASAAVGSALDTMAEHPNLANSKFTRLVAELAGKVSTLVKQKQLSQVQGSDVLQSILETLSENPVLFLDVENRLAGFVLEATVKAAAKSNGLASGMILVQTIESVGHAAASTGAAAIKNHAAADLETQLENVLSAGLERAGKELGNKMNLSMLPKVLQALVEAWARGEIATVDPANDNFRRAFSDLVAKAAA